MLTLVSKHQESKDVWSFVFSPSEPLSFEPGQHINIMLKHDTPDIRGIVRSFTICSSSVHPDVVTIATRLGQSSFKRALFKLEVGQGVEARSPGGLFVMKKEPGLTHVMIAAGIGITPYMSMIRSAVDSGAIGKMVLIYSAKTPDELTFQKVLDGAATKIPLRIVYTVTQPVDDHNWQGRVGRIDEALLKRISSEAINPTYYICGPHEFVMATTQILTDMGVPKERVEFEKFSGYV